MATNTPKLNVVIADDDAVTRGALRMLLNEQHYSVVGEATDGEKAVELCLQCNPDIVFLDINMPKLTGHQVAEQVRLKLSRTRIVIITSLPTVANVQQAMAGGATAFLVKPFTAAKVVDAVSKCLKDRSLARGQAAAAAHAAAAAGAKAAAPSLFAPGGAPTADMPAPSVPGAGAPKAAAFKANAPTSFMPAASAPDAPAPAPAAPPSATPEEAGNAG